MGGFSVQDADYNETSKEIKNESNVVGKNLTEALDQLAANGGEQILIYSNQDINYNFDSKTGAVSGSRCSIDASKIHKGTLLEIEADMASVEAGGDFSIKLGGTSGTTLWTRTLSAGSGVHFKGAIAFQDTALSQIINCKSSLYNFFGMGQRALTDLVEVHNNTDMVIPSTGTLELVMTFVPASMTSVHLNSYKITMMQPKSLG